MDGDWIVQVHPRSEGFDMRMPKLLIGALALAFLFSTSAYAQKGRSSSSSRPSGGSSKPSSGGSMFGGSKPSTSSKPPSSAIGGKSPTGAGSSMFGGSKPSTSSNNDKKSPGIFGGGSSKPTSVKPGSVTTGNQTSSKPSHRQCEHQGTSPEAGREPPGIHHHPEGDSPSQERSGGWGTDCQGRYLVSRCHAAS